MGTKLSLHLDEQLVFMCLECVVLWYICAIFCVCVSTYLEAAVYFCVWKSIYMADYCSLWMRVCLLQRVCVCMCATLYVGCVCMLLCYCWYNYVHICMRACVTFVCAAVRVCA